MYIVRDIIIYFMKRKIVPARVRITGPFDSYLYIKINTYTYMLYYIYNIIKYVTDAYVQTVIIITIK